MAFVDKIQDEKLQYDINREAASISALSSGKVDKYEHLTSEEILPSDQSRITEQAKFTYSPVFPIWKTNKNNWKTWRKTNKGTWRAWETTS